MHNKRGNIFRKTLFFYLIVAVLFIVFLELYISKTIRKNYLENMKTRLTIEARLIEQYLLPLDSEGNLDSFSASLKNITGARVTIINMAGKVIGDSDKPSEEMENHLERPEIKDALISGIGFSIRYSNTLKTDLYYLALPVVRDGREVGFLRLAIPLSGIQSDVGKVRLRIIVASVFVLIIAVLVGFFRIRRTERSFTKIVDFAKSLSSGDLKTRLFPEESGEFRELAEILNRMSTELRERIDLEEGERLKLEIILRSMSDGLLLVDTEGRMVLANDAIKEIFGLSDTPEGKAFIGAIRNLEIHEMIEFVKREGSPLAREIEITYPKELYIMAKAFPLFSKENIMGVVITLHDITRIKKLEEIRRDFVANVSHELKTPITAIKGFAETLLMGAIEDKDNALKFLETIKSHSERLNSLIDDLLTLSKIELEVTKIEKQDVDMREVINVVFTTLNEKAYSKGLYLKQSLMQDPPMLYADRDKLIQILLNLVDNGIKFTEKGGITVGMERLDDRLALFVEDTGIGIPRNHLARLGERFYRVDRARSRELGGTGLGLAIVKHLVKAHGWDMKIESTPGKGTKVWIFIDR
jgi:two-component system phosphate regulon sensor histidine kinase PhoR